MKRILSRYLPSLTIFSAILFIFSYKLFSSFNFHPDFARDIYDMLTIIQGKPSLIGPKISFGGFYQGPYYYYLFLPIFFLTRLNINSLLIFNLILFLLGLAFFYLKIKHKYGVLSSSLAALVIGFSPFYIIYSRSPWNGSTYLPFLLIFILSLYFLNPRVSKIGLFSLGILAGVILNIHISALIMLIFATAYLLYFLKKKTDYIYFFLGLILTFLPLLFFELKHDFVMFKNTFVVGSYKSFIENTNIPNALSGKKNIYENFFFIANIVSSQIGLSVFLIFAAFALLWKKIREKQTRFFIVACLCLLIFLSFVLRFQVGMHYLFSLSFLIIFTITVALLHSGYKWLLIPIILLELYSFPKNIYSQSTRNPEKYEKAAHYVIEHKLIQKNESFNVVQYSKDYTFYVPIGHEYRFFLRKNKFIPKSEFEYNSSDKLLIFSEVKDLDISKLNSWEIEQFGKEYLKNGKRYYIGDIILYVVKKS